MSEVADLTPQHDEAVDMYRRRCYGLDPLVNRPGPADSQAVEHLRDMVRTLRQVGH